MLRTTIALFVGTRELSNLDRARAARAARSTPRVARGSQIRARSRCDWNARETRVARRGCDPLNATEVRRVRVEKRASKCARSARENFFRISALLIALSSAARGDDDVTALPKTQPLTMTGDLAAQMVDGVDRFLLRKTDESVAKRARHWHRDFSSVEAYNKSVEPNRKRLAHILGVRDERIATEEAFSSPMSLDPNANFPLVGLSGKIVWTPMTWPVFGDVFVEAILVTTSERDIKATVVLIPDADTPPEELLGLTPKTADSYPIAIRLADSGCQVVIMPLVDRTLEGRNGRSKLTTREWLHRSAYELGRTLTGYETQCALAVVDQQLRKRTQRPVGVFGIGEGGLVALYAAALDPRISAALVSGAFDDRLRTWSEPVERNVFGVLDQFGGAELASLVAPRPLIIEACAWPKVEVNAGDGGAPGILESPAMSAVAVEHNRARELLKGLNSSLPRLIPSGETGDGPPASDSALSAFLHALHSEITLAPNTKPDRPDITMPPAANHDVTQSIKQRQTRLNHALDRHNQQLLAESPYVRAEFMKKLDTSSPETYAKTVEEYRRIFYDDVIGRFDDEMLPANPRSRKIYETDKLTGYEVVLDVWSDVFAYGILVLPKDLKDGEKRPVVVCQHGLEGRPQDLADPKVDNPAYNQFALRLAERGFITFAPQNLYIGQDKFRTLQRKANPLGKTLFSIIVPQHQQITDWLNTLPFVDGDRIAFYGLSYGGKSAMRIPPLVKNYCLSICSADFNEWVWKNASTRSPYSYVWSGEYEIFEWDLGSTFNYAEMAALIAPRPFMVERGHFDGVAPDETVAYEFAKVRNLYAARLKLPPEDCQIEWFVGPHTIHGVGTFKFLHHHLKWPIRDDQPIVPLNK